MVQTKKSAKELAEVADPVWPLVQTWLHDSENAIEVLAPSASSRGTSCLEQLQLSARSVIGSVVLETAGIKVDHGWILLLGHGSEHMPHSILSWNGMRLGDDDHMHQEPWTGALIVAVDVLGGVFAINGGATKANLGWVFYLAPDSLLWEEIEHSYSAFLDWICHGDIESFYQELRWPNWLNDIRSNPIEMGYCMIPPAWAKGPPLCERKREMQSLASLAKEHREKQYQLHTRKKDTNA